MFEDHEASCELRVWMFGTSPSRTRHSGLGTMRLSTIIKNMGEYGKVAEIRGKYAVDVLSQGTSHLVIENFSWVRSLFNHKGTENSSLDHHFPSEFTKAKKSLSVFGLNHSVSPLFR